MFLEIQLSVIKSGCHPDSWLESEDQRIKKAADVSLVGTDYRSLGEGIPFIDKVGSQIPTIIGMAGLQHIIQLVYPLVG